MNNPHIYLTDAYIKEFTAKIVEIDFENKGVVLDRTAFYPVGGGQPSDRGRLIKDSKEYVVEEVRKKEGKVMHFLNEIDGLKKGDGVKGILDWERRYKIMRLHTACHVLSAVVHKETGALITGNQIKENEARIDFDLEGFDREQIKSFEEKSNQVIARDLQVSVKFLPREEAFKLPSVVKLKNVLPPNIEIIRIVDIVGFDQQACGGTHVKQLSEVGTIRIIKAENKGKNNRRIYFTLENLEDN